MEKTLTTNAEILAYWEVDDVASQWGTYNVLTPAYTIREEEVEGRPHLIVPVVMMKEGVHNGSHGPIFHRSEQLSRNTDIWNGIPVTISHPKKNGTFVSANSPEQLTQSAVGRIFAAHYEDGLRAEAYIDLERIRELSPEALAYIRQGRPLDVSVGVFNDTRAIEGEWHGETYGFEASNYRPDHLALLPGETGACSWNDGCGVRANNEGGEMEDLLKTFKELSEKGFMVSPIVYEQGYRELTQSLQSKLNTLDTNERVYYLQEVYADHFIYQVRDRERGDSTLYKRNYSATDSDVELADNPVEVFKKVEYVTMAAKKPMRRTKAPIINSNSDNMTDEKKPCCEAKVDALIQNNALHWKAEDREWLMTQEESVIDKMSPKDGPKVAPIEVNAEEVLSTFKATLQKVEDYTELMPEEMKAVVEGGVKLYKEHREALVKHIMDNTDKDVWEQTELAAMSDIALEKISKSLTNAPADYSGQGGGGGTSEKGVKPMAPFGYKAPVAN